MPEIADVKIAVLKCAMGIKSLPEKELYERLEQFWCAAFKIGCAETGEAMKSELRQRGFIRSREPQPGQTERNDGAV